MARSPSLRTARLPWPQRQTACGSILDSKGIVLNKEDRVSVEKDGDTTILRVRRVTHGEETRTAVVPYSTQTIIDSNLPEGQSEIRQQGVNGEKPRCITSRMSMAWPNRRR